MKLLLIKLFLPVFLFSIVSAQEISQNKIKIGVILPLTGDAQTYGLDIKDTILYATEKMAPNTYELVFQDDKCSARDGLTATQRVVQQDKVSFVIGFACSSSALGSAPVLNKNKIPSLVVFASSPRIADAGEYVFRIFPSDIYAAETLHKYLTEQQTKSATMPQNLAIVSVESDYAQDFKKSFLSFENKKKVFSNIITEDFLPDFTDFKSLFAKLKTKGVDALFLNPQVDSQLALMVKQLDELQWKPQLYSAYFPSSENMLKNYVNFMNEIIFVDAPNNSAILTQEGVAALEEYKQTHKFQGMDIVFPYAYEGVKVMHQAIQESLKKNSNDRSILSPSIIEYFNKTTFDGIFGKYSFDKAGELVGGKFSVKTIKDGKVELLQ